MLESTNNADPLSMRQEQVMNQDSMDSPSKSFPTTVFSPNQINGDKSETAPPNGLAENSVQSSQPNRHTADTENDSNVASSNMKTSDYGQDEPLPTLEDAIHRNNQRLEQITQRLNSFSKQLFDIQKQITELANGVTVNSLAVNDSTDWQPGIDDFDRPDQPFNLPLDSQGDNVTFHSSKKKLEILFEQTKGNSPKPTTKIPLNGTPERLDADAETETGRAWNSRKTDHSFDGYINRLIECLHNISTEDYQTTESANEEISGIWLNESALQMPDARPLEHGEYVPSSVAPESSSNLIAMRELANAAASIAAKLSTKRRKFWFWIRSVSGLTALTGCFISLAVSDRLGDSASMTGGILMVIGLSAGLWLQRSSHRVYRNTNQRLVQSEPRSPSNGLPITRFPDNT